MGIKKLLKHLDEFFDQSKKKQKKKSEKLSKLIVSLEEKKSEIKDSLKTEAIKCKKSKKTYEFCKEFKALCRMLKKAKKQEDYINNDDL